MVWLKLRGYKTYKTTNDLHRNIQNIRLTNHPSQLFNGSGDY